MTTLNDNPKRNIYTFFFADNLRSAVIKTNTATYLRQAVMRAGDALEHEHYPGARVAVIYDNNFGLDHCIIVMHPNGRVEKQYLRDDYRNPELSQLGKKALKVSRKRNQHTTDKIAKGGKVVQMRQRKRA